MDNVEKAIVRSCLVQIQVGMEETRQVAGFWAKMTPGARQEWKDFARSVAKYQREMTEG